MSGRSPLVLALLLAAACADGGVDTGRDAGGTPADTSVSNDDDEDGDGVPVDRDCDDADPRMGSTAERPCVSDCAPGVEQCFDGIWMACSAPMDCECTAGTPPRDIACERCGTQRQTCVDGRWVNEGVCTSGMCAPGDVEMGGACGNCGVERRTCGMDCTWAPAECIDQGACAPGATRDGCDPCGHQVCNAECRWGECAPRPGAQCLRIRPGTTGPAGNNYRCCGASRWQFCLPSCVWSTDCALCSGCGC